MKAENNDIEKAEDYVEEMYSKNAMIAQKENLEKLMSEAKKNGNYEKLFGKRAQNAIIFGEDVSEQDEEKTKKSKKKVEKNDKVEKGLFDDMSLSEAEDILFS